MVVRVLQQLLPGCCGHGCTSSLCARFKRRAKTIAVKLTLPSILYAARSGLEHPGVNTIEESWPETDLQTSKRSEERELSASN